MKAQPSATAKAPSPASEQSITASLTAEIMRDLDDGRPTLVAYTEGNAGDLREVSPARLRGMVAAARAQLDEIERLADEQEARDTLAAMLAEHQVELDEWDTATLDPKLRPHFLAAYDQSPGSDRVIVVPLGQDPVQRLAVVADLLQRMERARGERA
ncbi:hypothetical protein [Streptomyces sp. NPDC056628]|uniref:hypothetical protein n=1 Tax=Streptomyces sp. NPDC056628 TaxID=3345882 RepID=UPI0036C155D0